MTGRTRALPGRATVVAGPLTSATSAVLGQVIANMLRYRANCMGPMLTTLDQIFGSIDGSPGLVEAHYLATLTRRTDSIR